MQWLWTDVRWGNFHGPYTGFLYAMVKYTLDFKLENYLVILENCGHQTALSKFHISSYNLRIEPGIYETPKLEPHLHERLYLWLGSCRSCGSFRMFTLLRWKNCMRHVINPIENFEKE